MPILPLVLWDTDAEGPNAAADILVSECIVAGWTGRDRAALEHHIAELEKLGVKRPASTPIFYRVSAARLTVDDAIEATGTASSGEAEFVLLKSDGKLWIGVGSDHTDREVETYNVTVSKQMCEKPIAPMFWAFDAVADHWDELQLRSTIVEHGVEIVYQAGSVAAMLPPAALLALWNEAADLAEGHLMFCGTLAAKGGIRPSPRFNFELHDPVLRRTIRGGYGITELPVVG